MNNQIEVPLNILKEKVLYSLPFGSEIDDDAVKIVSIALNYFLNQFVKKIQYTDNKILVKDIKNHIEENEFSFLRRLVEK